MFSGMTPQINKKKISQLIQTILKITPFSNTTAEPDETTTYAAVTDIDYIDLNELIEKVQQNTTNAQGFTFHFFSSVFFFISSSISLFIQSTIER